FNVQATAAGFYQGNDDDLLININTGTQVAYNVTGARAFTAAGEEGVDIFQVLSDLKKALETNDPQGIIDQMENLEKGHKQLTLNQSLCGTKAQRVELARNNMGKMDLSLTTLLSSIQDADMSEVATQLAMKDLVLQSTYAVTAKLNENTLLNYLR
ncbi:MAG: hypothetical protein FWE89_05395, partial [Syntrophaceae bacterium]|nr:hypothetical protein [Syntrophaceae bacterium]